VERAIFVSVAAEAVAKRPVGELDLFMARASLIPSVSDVAFRGKDCKRNSPLPYLGCG
jgi:hypothetical protein